MPPLAALSSNTRLEVAILGAFVIWTVAGGLVATYGQGRGFRFWPLFISAFFLGFPLVLLGVALAAGPDRG